MKVTLILSASEGNWKTGPYNKYWGPLIIQTIAGKRGTHMFEMYDSYMVSNAICYFRMGIQRI